MMCECRNSLGAPGPKRAGTSLHLFRLAAFALTGIEICQVIHDRNDTWMIWPEGLLQDRQRTAEEFLRLRVSPFRMIARREVIECPGQIGMIGAGRAVWIGAGARAAAFVRNRQRRVAPATSKS